MQTKAADCEYNKYDRRLTEQFIHGLDDEGMISEILREVSALENINDTTSKWVPLWAQRVEAQRAQKNALDNIKEAQDFNSFGQNTQRHDNVRCKKQKWVEHFKEQSTLRDRTLPTTKCAGDAERPTTSGQCAG